MASADTSHQIENMGGGSRKKARTETQGGDAHMAVPTTSMAWIPVVEQVVEYGGMDKAGSKAGKMKARARAKAKQKPTDTVTEGNAVPVAPSSRKSQRARHTPAKFRYLVPRPLGQQQQGLPPIAPAFIHPPNSNGLPPLPLPRNLMLPFPSMPVSTPPGNNSLPVPIAVTAPLHLSSFLPPLQPSSTSAVSPAHAGDRLVPTDRRPLSVASKRSAVRRRFPAPSEKHASQRSSPNFQGSAAERVTPSSAGHTSITETTAIRAASSAYAQSTNVSAMEVGSSSRGGSSVGRAPQACSRPCVTSTVISTSCPPTESRGETPAKGLYARKPPLPPSSWYRKSLPQNLPFPPPAILHRSFAHVPPLPSREGHSVVPPRASLNNRQLGGPKPPAGIPPNPLLGKSQVMQGVANPHSVPWLVPPQRGSRQLRVSVSNSGGQTDGDSGPGQTRSQQKRRMRQLKNGLGKKFQSFVEGAKLVEEPDSQTTGVQNLKQIVLTEEQRMKLVNDMIEACRADPKFREKYIDAVRQLSYFGVLQTASYQLVAQGASKAAREVVDAWKYQRRPMQEDSASVSLYKAVNKVHEEGIETMQKLPSLKEANSCHVGKRNDGAWIVTISEDKKRKLTG